ncbi:exostosin domain-containing protein [Rubrivirga sp.]|uniref:exostosin domain-containing protein n=1 Tax=Rubrivirga sp. TaxID=1885344 RepID=UPI003C70C2F8
MSDTRTTIYFDLSAETIHQANEWRSLLDDISGGAGTARIVSHAHEADIVVRTKATPYVEGIAALRTPAGRYERKASPRHVIWDDNDHPTGLQPGLYCSLPQRLHDSARHRTGPYPITYNEQVEAYDLGDARHLATFHGGLTHRVRRQVVGGLSQADRASVIVQGGEWNRMFTRSGTASKLSYAESLRRTKFFVCPRGRGTGSIRLFETMKAARVPVIISDSYVLPVGIDWSTCAVIIPERYSQDIAGMLAEVEDQWTNMALAARDAWEAHYSSNTLLDTVAESFRAVAGRGAPSHQLAVTRVVTRQMAVNAVLRANRILRSAVNR